MSESSLMKLRIGTSLAALLAAGVAMPALAKGSVSAEQAAQSAQPGQESDANTQEIVVVGAYAKGLQTSISTKRDASGIVDAIMASDIGKLPAVNVAEALQRVAGVSIVREAGEGEFISVRGLGPNFQEVTLNGAPVAVNENIRNSDQSGRQFRFRVLPADLISGVVVAKSSSADQIDGGIGALVDVQTLAPLSRKPFLALRAFGHYDDRTHDFTPNGSISASWKNSSGTFGVAAGLSYQDTSAQFERLQTFGYTQRTVNGTAGVFVPDTFNTTLELERRKRISGLVTAQWRPSSSFETRLDVFYSRFNNSIIQTRAAYNIGGAVAQFVPGTAVVRDNVLVSADIARSAADVGAEYSEQLHQNYAIRWSGKFESGGWRVEPALSFSRALSGLVIPLQRIDGRTAVAAGSVVHFDLGTDPVHNRRIAALYADQDLTNPAVHTQIGYRNRPINSKDRDLTGTLNIRREISTNWGGFDFTDFKFGGQYTSRSRDYQRRDRSLALKAGQTLDTSFFDQVTPSNAFSSTVGRTSLYSYANFSKFSNAYTIINNEFPGGVSPSAYDLVANAADLRTSYRIDEKVGAIYGKLDFKGELHGVPFSGDIGVRWSDTRTTVFGTRVEAASNGNGGITTVTSPRVTNNRYQNFLPSATLTFKPRNNVFLRLAASKTITRPSLGDLRDALSPNSNVTNRIFTDGQAALTGPNPLLPSDLTAVGGNPNLKPYESKNFDASFEWYFNRFGAISVAAFHKDIKNFVSGSGSREDIPFLTQAGPVVVASVIANRPRNVGNASISGLEVSFSDKFDFGLGISTSATLITTDLSLKQVDGTLSRGVIQGVPKFNYTISPFFEKGPFETHVSWTFRSAVAVNSNLTVASDPRLDPNTFITQLGFGTLDFGASYKIGDHFEVYVDGSNLTNSRESSYIGSESRPFQINNFGRSFNFGVRGQF